MATPSLKIRCWISIFTISSIYLAQSATTYIVHMDSSAMPKPFSTHHTWFSSLLSSLSADSATPTAAAANPIYTYTNSIHGFSATLSPSQLQSLKSSPGYISSSPDFTLKLHTTRTPQFLGLTSDHGAWPASNHGDGIIIGLVDTGVWPESESLKDDEMSPVPSRWKGECEEGIEFNSSMCNKKLIGARIFHKGFTAKHPKFKMNSCRDRDGHGTHTSSTAAGSAVKGASYFGYANGTARGMAPRSHIAMYKVVWDYGRVYSSDVVAAIDSAIQDGVDVLSLSLGMEENPLSTDPISMACFAAMEKGIFVAASAGNSGPLFGTVENGAPWLVTVAAGTIDRELHGVLTLGNGVRISFPSLYPGDSSLNHKPLVFLDGCQSMNIMKKFRDKIVVCSDRQILNDQVSNARTSKVLGAVFISNSSISESYTRIEFPAAFIGLKDGETVIDFINKMNNSNVSMEFRKTNMGTKPAPMVDSYSSRGPFSYCPSVMKPDILAPGTSVLASWSRSNIVFSGRDRNYFSNFNILSGTSMAAPHVAGVAALVKAAHPDWSPAAIRSAIMTTADSLDNDQNPIRQTLNPNSEASPLAMGAGQINPNRAMDPGLIYNATAEDYINLLCGMKFTKREIQAITRSSSSSEKCLNPYLDLNYPSFIAYFNDVGSSENEKIVKVFSRTLTNVGDGGSSYNAYVSPMEGLQVKVEPRKLVFKKKGERLSYKLSLEGPKWMDTDVVYGDLRWVSSDGKYVARSPIVATSLILDDPL